MPTTTPFPARPCDVVALTVQEFTRGLDVNAAASIDVICQRFLDDANRALVWLIRFRALQSWCARADIAVWLTSGSAHPQHACEVAASFRLNGQWEFDSDSFRSAVESVNCRR